MRLGAVGLIGIQGVSRFPSEAFLARIYPMREVDYLRWLIELDVGQVPKSCSGSIE